MKVVVSGGTGFIGKRVVERLLLDGHSVSVLSRKPANEKHAVASFAWDPLSEEPPAESVNGMDAVMHLAGEPVNQRWDAEVKKRILDSRVLGTRHLVDAIARATHRPKILVSTSAVGYYGERGDEVLNERSGPGKGFLADVCKGWEAEALRAETLGVRVIRLRIGFVLGRDGGALDQILPVFRMGLGGPLGSGKQWMPWIHAADVAGLFAFALESPASAVWNAVAPHPVTNTEFTRALAKAVHRPAIFPVPGFALQLMFGELGQHMLDSARVLPDGALKAGYVFSYPGLNEALPSLVAKRH